MKEYLDECRDMLDRNLNRMMVCDTFGELKLQFSFAIRRVCYIYDLRVDDVCDYIVDKTIGQRIRQFRIENVLTQAQLADMLGVGQTTVSSWETGVNEPNIVTLKKISSVLGVTVTDLIF